VGVTVIVATFGSAEWQRRAEAVAVPSAVAQLPDELIVEHGRTLADARNDAARRARSEWLCFLDADDQLEPGYLAALRFGFGDLRAPAVRYVTPGEPEPEPVTFEGRDISTINPCVIGTLIRREMLLTAGGFWQERAWEDWSLFRRCWLLGASIEHHPAAVYRATVGAGRNSTVANRQQLHRDILTSHDQWQKARAR